jgi:hypothetical protein
MLAISLLVVGDWEFDRALASGLRGIHVSCACLRLNQVMMQSIYAVWLSEMVQF